MHISPLTVVLGLATCIALAPGSDNLVRERPGGRTVGSGERARAGFLQEHNVGHNHNECLAVLSQCCCSSSRPHYAACRIAASVNVRARAEEITFRKANGGERRRCSDTRPPPAPAKLCAPTVYSCVLARKDWQAKPASLGAVRGGGSQDTEREDEGVSEGGGVWKGEDQDDEEQAGNGVEGTVLWQEQNRAAGHATERGEGRESQSEREREKTSKDTEVEAASQLRKRRVTEPGLLREDIGHFCAHVVAPGNVV